MKKLLLATIICSMFLPSFAQRAVKLNVGSLIFNTLYLNYEQAINDKSSFNIGVHRMFKTGLPGDLDSDFQTSDEAVNLESPDLDGYGITAEYRIYTSSNKEGLSGFYVAPFLRHSSYSISGEDFYEDDNNVSHLGQFSVSLKNNLGLGLAIGTHFNLGENWSIDVMWIGGGFSFSKLKGTVTTEDPTLDFRDAEQDFIEEINENKYWDSYTLEKDKAEITTVGFKLPIIRGNIAIGYRF